jgi:hypothetical protein
VIQYLIFIKTHHTVTCAFHSTHVTGHFRLKIKPLVGFEMGQSHVRVSSDSISWSHYRSLCASHFSQFLTSQSRWARHIKEHYGINADMILYCFNLRFVTCPKALQTEFISCDHHTKSESANLFCDSATPNLI